MALVVAIDGPAGTGKSSAARILAQRLSFVYVDTGAIYRALAFLVDKFGKDASDQDQVLALVPFLTVKVDNDAHCTKIVIDGKEVLAELRTEKISRLSSLVSQHKAVREALLPVQRNLTKKISGGAIFEGRDIGTVVFPNAPVKIFITATSETRARRRFQELKEGHAGYQEVLDEIRRRDERDESRQSAPMQKAKDAHVIDSSNMTLEEVIKEALTLIEQVKSLPVGELW